jgi:predicted esterase
VTTLTRRGSPSPDGAGVRSAAAVHTIAATTHGRYLVAPADTPGPAPLLVGFHGYGEHAERHLAELDRIPGSERWTRVAVQALHRHYSASRRQVVGSWMTRQDRELAIDDNIAYVRDVVGAVRDACEATDCCVYCGFSQGVAMAYRAALRAGHACRGIVALAGDVPPELQADPDLTWPPVLIGRGRLDTWYTQEKMDADLGFLRHAGTPVASTIFDGGHEWTDDFRTRAGRFLTGLV